MTPPTNHEWEKQLQQKLQHYNIGTKFIDDHFLSATKGVV